MNKKKILVEEGKVQDVYWNDSTRYDNLMEIYIPSKEFDNYVTLEPTKDKYGYNILTISLDFSEVNSEYFSNVVAVTERIHLLSDKDYATLRKALNVFEEFTIEFYIDTDLGDEEFSIRFIA